MTEMRQGSEHLLPHAVRDAVFWLGLSNRDWLILQELLLNRHERPKSPEGHERTSALEWLARKSDEICQGLSELVAPVDVLEAEADRLLVAASQKDPALRTVAVARSILRGAGATQTQTVDVKRLLLSLQVLILHGDVQVMELWPKTAELVHHLQLPVAESSTISGLGAESNSPNRLEQQLSELKIAERTWTILDARVNQEMTLSDIGEGVLDGLSRERVRQLEMRGLKRLRRGRASIHAALDVLEANKDQLWQPFDQNISLNAAAKLSALLLEEAGWGTVALRDAQRLLLSIRALIADGAEEMTGQWRHTTYAVCALRPYVEKHWRVSQKLVEIAEAERRWSYREIAEHILRQEGEPLHWQEIAERGEDLGRRDNFNYTSLYNVLSGNKTHFVRTDQGTYGLKVWGLESPDYYVDIIADVLGEEGETLSFGAIYQKVENQRPIKKSSLYLFLDTHPRFYCSISGGYGLRAWLSPRERQNLRTPDHLVESRKSFERVARAEEKGYDVDRMVSEDRQEYVASEDSQ